MAQDPRYCPEASPTLFMADPDPRGNNGSQCLCQQSQFSNTQFDRLSSLRDEYPTESLDYAGQISFLYMNGDVRSVVPSPQLSEFVQMSRHSQLKSLRFSLRANQNKTKAGSTCSGVESVSHKKVCPQFFGRYLSLGFCVFLILLQNRCQVPVSNHFQSGINLRFQSLVCHGVATMSRLLKIIGFFYKKSIFCKRDV